MTDVYILRHKYLIFVMVLLTLMKQTQSLRKAVISSKTFSGTVNLLKSHYTVKIINEEKFKFHF